jgi:putative 4-mercaptohistidine N1-methyltranferase
VEAGALEFPARCVSQCLDAARLPAQARALDLGCAVGRSSFELARHCAEVIGIDFSKQFIDLANRLRQRGSLRFKSCEEGELTRARRAVVPPDIDRRRVKFEVGDATRLRADLGEFDVVLAANLIDRLEAPMKCLERLPGLLRPGGQLIVASPYTWLASYTPRKNWLGGFARGGRPVKTFDALRRILSPHFKLARRLDLPFLLREHARKYQLGISEASVWVRR